MILKTNICNNHFWIKHWPVLVNTFFLFFNLYCNKICHFSNVCQSHTDCIASLSIEVIKILRVHYLRPFFLTVPNVFTANKYWHWHEHLKLFIGFYIKESANNVHIHTKYILDSKCCLLNLNRSLPKMFVLFCIMYFKKSCT